MMTHASAPQKCVNRVLARQLAQHITVEPKECWKNSVLALSYCNDPAACYVEGYVSLEKHGIYIEHGWLEVADEIVDVTLDDLAAHAYHAVLFYPRPSVVTMLHDTDRLPFFISHRDLMRTMHDYQQQLYAAVLQSKENP